MDHKSIALLIGIALLLCTAAAMPNSHVISCCTQVSKKVNPKLLRRAKLFDIQDDRICAIKAVILLRGSHKLCVDPNNAQLKRWMARNKKQIPSRA
ncbi:C-C motif chemokine 27-like [Pristis pectinata]|uniref:C-C motif chemokine 27-like n=1 Tax=Pristis pectinata TaxID=685728 RepID=UPI00223D35FE|nr:C-C motif chemokine 27-like [Pristis pectinata]